MKRFLTAITAGVLLALGLLLSAQTIHAGSATWKASPASRDWNTATNWTPQVIPNAASDTATFATSDRTAVSISGGPPIYPEFSGYTVVNGIVFNAGASAFTINAPYPFELKILGAGIANNSGNTQNFTGRFSFSFSPGATSGSQNIFTINGGRTRASSDGDFIRFYSGSAGNSTFILNGGTESEIGGEMVFYGSSTAADALVIANGGVASGGLGGSVRFEDTSSAGNATLIANTAAVGYGGTIEFSGKSHGDKARVKVFGAGSLHLPEYRNQYADNLDFAVGSIEGDGSIYLTPYSALAMNLLVGGNNLNTTFSGVIRGDYGGSLTKIGTGTLTLTGANYYTGATTIKRGRLLVNNTTGSGTGTSAVQVNAGKLGGNGIIGSYVTIGDGIGRGASLSAGINSTSPSTLTIEGSLTFNSDATYKVQLDSTGPKADKVVIGWGVTINSGAQFSFTELGSGTLAPGTVFTIISNLGPEPIAGTFSNLADGTMFASNGNNYQVNYKGGDGNDLTLTVIP